jgi:arsenite/tail-anchored protein-transporting ATPase
MRVILYTGKGGVGKTTTAAATAVAAAGLGLRTLVMSTDPAHSLGDALGVELGADGKPVAVEGVEGLATQQIGPPTALDDSWRVVQSYLLSVLEVVGIDAVVAEELTALPGAGEIAALLELRHQVGSEEWDLVIVDCAPTAETLRLLALPEALAWHLQRLVPGQRALIRTLRPAAAAAAGVPIPEPGLVEVVRSWHSHLREVHRILAGEQTSVRLVLTPERVVIAESRRTWTSLSLFGFTVDGVVVNRVFPPADGAPSAAARGGAKRDAGQGDSWRAAWNTAQKRGLEEVRQSFHGIPVVTAPYLPGEPVGPQALAAMAVAMQPGPFTRASLLDRPQDSGLQVSREGEDFVLTLSLPFVTSAEVGLQRRGDDLLIVVGDHRRVLTLPAALQRCIVTGASVRRSQLRVRFAPDEEVWPRG